MADLSHRSHDHPQQQQQLQQRGQEAVDSFKSFLHEKAPSSSQILAVVTVFPIGAFLLFLAGLALTGSVIGLAVTAPLFILFSPILVPATLAIGLAVTGFLASGAFGITGLSAFSWIINFFRGTRAGATMERITRQAHETAGKMGQNVEEMGKDVASRAYDTAKQMGQVGQNVASKAYDTASQMGQEVKETAQEIAGTGKVNETSGRKGQKVKEKDQEVTIKTRETARA